MANANVLVFGEQINKLHGLKVSIIIVMSLELYSP